MLIIEQVKQIAEHMGHTVDGYKTEFKSNMGIVQVWISMPELEARIFDPLEDFDNHNVFKALVDECKKREWHVLINKNGFAVENPNGPCVVEYYGNKEFNNESICLAYLAVMGE